jgi:transcriptional regulator with XRE-family HTH domain
MTFGKRVKQLRKAKGLTQRELADTVAARLKDQDRRGFDVTYLSKIENDRMPPPSTPAIIELGKQLDADVDELLALAKRVPPDMSKKLTDSKGARTFYRSALEMGLSEADWKKLLEQIKKDKGEQ